MSRILRRPMFRGGPVSSYGTGIASGLANGGRVGFDNGGFLPAWAKNLDTRGYQIGSDLLNKQPTSLETTSKLSSSYKILSESIW